ncbi:hypothetical protein [Minwuia sp.]|uniref:hypothetical protein n=1 Tax=Minwuia sp. TaxID=2493630 RepID=UPI003A8DA20B
MNIRETIIAVTTILTFGVVLSACDDTIRGIGQDTKQTVDAVSDSVQGKPKENAED